MADVKALLMAVVIVATAHTTDSNITVTDSGPPLQASTSPESTTHMFENTSAVTGASSSHASNSTAMPDNETSTLFNWLMDPENASSLSTNAHNASWIYTPTTNTSSVVSYIKMATAETSTTPRDTTDTGKDVVMTTLANAQTTTPEGSSTQISSITAYLAITLAFIHFLM